MNGQELANMLRGAVAALGCFGLLVVVWLLGGLVVGLVFAIVRAVVNLV